MKNDKLLLFSQWFFRLISWLMILGCAVFFIATLRPDLFVWANKMKYEGSFPLSLHLMMGFFFISTIIDFLFFKFMWKLFRYLRTKEYKLELIARQVSKISYLFLIGFVSYVLGYLLFITCEPQLKEFLIGFKMYHINIFRLDAILLPDYSGMASLVLFFVFRAVARFIYLHEKLNAEAELLKQEQQLTI